LSKPSVAVTISGQQYRIRSDEDEGVLRRAAAYVDAVMSRIRDRTGTVDSHDVAVLTALNLSHELLLQRERSVLGTHESERIESLAERVEQELASLAGLAADSEAASV
jgi:cell division protein ZapA